MQTYTKNGGRGAIVSAVGMPWVSPSVAPSYIEVRCGPYRLLAKDLTATPIKGSGQKNYEERGVIGPCRSISSPSAKPVVHAEQHHLDVAVGGGEHIASNRRWWWDSEAVARKPDVVVFDPR